MEIKNNYDEKLLKILKEWDEGKINELWKLVEQMMDALTLPSGFNPRRTSSTKNKDNWPGSWFATKIINHYWLNRLKRNENEDYKNYLERIKVFSWIENTNIENEDVNFKKIKQILVSMGKYKRTYLFNWLKQISLILKDVDSNASWLDLKKLIAEYENLLNENFKTFEQLFWKF